MPVFNVAKVCNSGGRALRACVDLRNAVKIILNLGKFNSVPCNLVNDKN